MSWLRARMRLIAFALLVSLGMLAGSTAVPHTDDCHESLCLGSVAPHDASQHSLTTPAAPEDHTLHCVVCHWTRLLRPHAEAVHHLAAAVPDSVRPPVEVITLPRLFPAAEPPLRSPPPART